MTWESSTVSVGETITAEQYNDLRTDVESVYNSAVPIGTMLMWAGSSGAVPTGWALCDGSAISRTTYSDLFTLLSTTFGSGDGSTTFNLPNMQDRFPVGAGNSYSRNAQGGASSNNISHTHSVSAHTHSIPSHAHNDGNLRADIDFEYNTGGGVYYDTAPNSFTANTRNNLYGGETSGSYGRSYGVDVSGNTGDWGGTSGSGGSGTTGSGGTTALDNRPPYIGILFIIKISA